MTLVIQLNSHASQTLEYAENHLGNGVAIGFDQLPDDFKKRVASTESIYDQINSHP